MGRYVSLGTLTLGTGVAGESDSVDTWGGRGTTPRYVPDKVVLYTEEDAFDGTITVEWSDDDTNFAAHYDSNRGSNLDIPAVSVIAVDTLQRYIRVNSDAQESDAATILVFGLYLGKGRTLP